MKNVFALVALAGIASVATAAPSLSFQVSTDGGSTWGSSASVLAGSSVQVRMVVDWTGTTAYGFSGTLAQLLYTGVDGSDNIVSSGANALRTAPFTFGSGGSLRGSASGSNLLVGLAGSGTTIGFLSFAQNAPASAGAGYSTANPAVIGSWSITVGAGRALGSTLGIGGRVSAAQGTGTGNPVGAFAFHAAAGSTGTSFRESGSVEGALITVVPTPGTLALVGLGGLVAGRRRR
jgi:hypothetical protein